jgi:hypothetical protein
MIISARAAVAASRHATHRALDDVGRGALHRRVDRGALGAGALRLIARGGSRQVQASPEHGFDVTRSRACWRVRSMKRARPDSG